MSIETPDRWLRAREAAAYLGCGRSTLYRRAAGDPSFPRPSYRLGRNCPRWSLRALAEWMCQGTTREQAG